MGQKTSYAYIVTTHSQIDASFYFIVEIGQTVSHPNATESGEGSAFYSAVFELSGGMQHSLNLI